MKDADLNLKADQFLSQFEQSIGKNPSSTWNDQLMQRISETPQRNIAGITSTKIGLIALLFIVINIAFCLKTFTNRNTNDSSRSTELTTISNELLIQTTTSIN